MGVRVDIEEQASMKQLKHRSGELYHRLNEYFSESSV